MIPEMTPEELGRPPTDVEIAEILHSVRGVPRVANLLRRLAHQVDKLKTDNQAMLKIMADLFKSGKETLRMIDEAKLDSGLVVGFTQLRDAVDEAESTLKGYVPKPRMSLYRWEDTGGPDVVVFAKNEYHAVAIATSAASRGQINGDVLLRTRPVVHLEPTIIESVKIITAEENV